MLWVVSRVPSGNAASTMSARRLTSAKALIFTAAAGLVHPDGGLAGIRAQLAKIPGLGAGVGGIGQHSREQGAVPVLRGDVDGVGILFHQQDVAHDSGGAEV